MPVRRPGAVSAAAVMSIIYGSLFGICGLIGLVSVAFEGAFAGGGGDPEQARIQKQIKDVMDAEMPAQKPYQISVNIVGLITSLAMLIAGIGMLAMHPWARMLAIAGSILGMLSYIFQIIYTIVFVLPATNKAVGAMLAGMPKQKGGGPPPDFAKAMEIGMTIGMILVVIMQMVIVGYLATILILLMRGHVRAAFANPTQAGDDDRYRDSVERRDRDDDRHDDRRRDDAYDEGYDRDNDDRRDSGRPDDRFR